MLGELLDELWSPLVAYLKQLVGNQDGAEDLAQEAFLRLWEHRAEWSPAGSVRSLLYRIGRNLALNERRSVGVRLRAAPQVRWQTGERRNPTPLDVVERKELRTALERALEQLSPRRREVFMLRQVHGLSVQETAEAMGISTQTVKNQMGTASAELRRILDTLL